ncbi:MAG: CRTAC1 family protein [Proteobacteria bacterium]|nr:CRTAC1 family protein [Pseudomonadota bacterium]
MKTTILVHIKIMPQNNQSISTFIKKSLVLVIGIFIIIVTFMIMQNIDNKNIDNTNNPDHKTTPLINKPKPPPKIPKTKFVEQAQLRGINFKHENGAIGNKLLPEIMGSGVAFFDYDNDGDQDIFFANATNWAWNSSIDSTQHIYANNGEGYFTETTKQLGLDASFYATGVAIGDINNDDFEDIFIAAIGTNHLYINQAGKAFIKSDELLDCTQDGWSTSSGFFDYDNDGDLDLMVLNYVQWSQELDLSANYTIDGENPTYSSASHFPATHNCLFENKNGRFTDVSGASGIVFKNNNKLLGKSLALTFVDINSDGWQDVIVTNDTSRNFIYINQRDKTFKEQSIETGLAYDIAGNSTRTTGIDLAYYKNTTNIAMGTFNQDMTLFYTKQQDNIFFTDASISSGIGAQSLLVSSFGLFFFDYDLDGNLDFFQTNGHIEKNINNIQATQYYLQKNQLFWNYNEDCGEDCEQIYTHVEATGDLNQLDIVGRAAAYADIDNDGDLDIIITQVANNPKLFINQSSTGNWIGIHLVSNNPIVGATITVHTSNNIRTYNYSRTKSYLSQVQKGQIIGLGGNKTDKTNKVHKIVINHMGTKKTITKVTINQWNYINFEL